MLGAGVDRGERPLSVSGSTSARHAGAEQPRLPHGFLDRPRLYALLDDEAAIATVAAPPGWGKSLLVAGWAHARGVAGTTCWHGAARRPGVAPRLPEPATGARRLVLDDLHRVPRGEVLDLLRAAAATGLPVLALGRRPLRGLVREALGVRAPEIGLDELRFTDDEVVALLEGTGRQPTAGAVRRILAATGGWPVAVDGAVRADGHGVGPAVLDYVEQEVLAELPGDLAELALSLAVVGRCDRALAAVLSSPDHVDAAGGLVERGLLTRDGDGFAFRPGLGPCLEELLRRRCRVTHVALQTRAADWFAGHGELSRALDHAERAGDPVRIRALLARTWPELVMVSPRRLREVLAELPDGGRSDRELRLAAAAAWAHLDASASARLLRGVPEPSAPAGPDDPSALRAALLGNAAGLLVGVRTGRLPTRELQAGPELRARVDQLPAAPDDALASAVALFALAQGGLHLLLGRLGPGEELLGMAAAQACLARLPRLEALSLADLALCRTLAGDIAGAEEALARCPEVATGTTESAGIALASALARLERGELGPARRHLAEARRDLGDRSRLPLLWHAEGVADLLSGDYEAGLERLAGVAATDTSSYLTELVAGTRTLLGRHVDGARAGAALPGAETPWGRMAAGLAHLLDGRPAAALDAVAPDLADPGAAGRTRVDVLVVAAAASLESGDRAAALSAAERALGRAEATGAWRGMHQLPRPLVGRVLALVESESASPRSRERVRAARRRLGLARDAAATTVAASTVAASTVAASTPLSRRELVVLSHIGTGRPVAAIAADLFVSTNTLKTQLRSIYRKLGVGSRGEAVARGRSLGIIS